MPPVHDANRIGAGFVTARLAPRWGLEVPYGCHTFLPEETMELGSIVTAVSLATKAYDLSKKASSLELQETIMSLREAIVDSRDQILELRTRIQELEAEARKSAEMQYEAPVYWKISGDKKDGPYCQPCWDKDQLAIRLQGAENDDYWRCQVCVKVFKRNGRHW
jgi:hypothetical protein